MQLTNIQGVLPGGFPPESLGGKKHTKDSYTKEFANRIRPTKREIWGLGAASKGPKTARILYVYVCFSGP